MALHPEVQKKAQADIEKVAPNRLPTFDDYDSLPYVKAIIKEILRWGPVAPLGLPHRVMEDDVYEGYFIPEGTTVVSNIWYILRLSCPNSPIDAAQGLSLMTRTHTQTHSTSIPLATSEIIHNLIHSNLCSDLEEEHALELI